MEAPLGTSQSAGPHGFLKGFLTVETTYRNSVDTRGEVSKFSRKVVRPSGWLLETYQPSQLPERAEQREDEAARAFRGSGTPLRGFACYRRAVYGGEGGHFLRLAQRGVSGAHLGMGRLVGKAWLGPQGPAGSQAVLGGITEGGRQPPGGHWGTGKRGRGLGCRQLILCPTPSKDCALSFQTTRPRKSTGQSKAHHGLSRGPGLELSPPWVSGCPQR